MGTLSNMFKRKKPTSRPNNENTLLKLLNDFQAIFTEYNGEIYDSEIVRACIDAIARNTAKLKMQHIGSAKFNNYLLHSPNLYMSNYDFIYKTVSKLYTQNNAFIGIERDFKGIPKNFIPIDYKQVKFSKNRQFVYFTLEDGNKITYEYNQVIHLRRHYNNKAMYGSSNYDPLDATIQAHIASNDGIINAVKSSARLRGILKYTQTLRPEDMAKQRDMFTKEYLGPDNDGGIAVLDAKADFTELKSDIKTIDDKQMSTIRENIYRYFGVSENIVKSSYTEDEYNSFYSSVIEPIAIQMSEEFTRKVFTEKEISCGNKIIFTAERLTFANNSTKATLINTLLPLGIISINEARTMLELSPIEDGDRHLVSLNYVDLSKANEYQLGKEVNEDEEGTKDNVESVGSETE